MSDGMLERAAKILRKRKAEREERLEEIMKNGTTPNKHQRVQEVPESRIDPSLMKSKEEGEAELEELRRRQRNRTKK